MLRTLGITFLALAVFVGTAAAQTTTPAPSPNQGAFDKLPPGNQKIAQALFDAQSKNGTTKPLSRDDIAAMKQHRGWGEIFKEMKANGQIPPDVKNLGQLVSGKYHPQSATPGGTTITNGSGKSQVVDNRGKPEFAGKSGKGRFDDDASAGGQGYSYHDNSGRGSFSSGPGGPGSSGHGGGRGK
jgi:hypothetical protein